MRRIIFLSFDSNSASHKALVISLIADATKNESNYKDNPGNRLYQDQAKQLFFTKGQARQLLYRGQRRVRIMSGTRHKPGHRLNSVYKSLATVQLLGNRNFRSPHLNAGGRPTSLKEAVMEGVPTVTKNPGSG